MLLKFATFIKIALLFHCNEAHPHLPPSTNTINIFSTKETAVPINILLMAKRVIFSPSSKYIYFSKNNKIVFVDRHALISGRCIALLVVSHQCAI